MPPWKSRAEMLGKAEQAGAAMIRLYEKQGNTPTAGSITTTTSAWFIEEAEIACEIDLIKCEHEYQRLQTHVKSLRHEDADNINAYTQINTGLEDWDGPAARAFRKQQARIVEFFEDQKELSLQALKFPLTLFSLGVNFRQAVYELHDAIIVMANAAVEEIEREEISVIVDVTAEGLTALITKASPVELMAKGIEMFVGTIAENVKDTVTGDSSHFDAIWNDQHNPMWEKIRESYDTTLDLLKREMSQWTDAAYDGNAKLFEPLPPSTDIAGPNFEYGYLRHHTVEPPPGFEDRVAEEKKRYAKKGGGFVDPNNPIQRRLDGE